MSLRGRIVIDLSKDSPERESQSQNSRLSQQHIPESQVLTPSSGDSGDEVQVLWDVRKGRHDAGASKTLKFGAPLEPGKNAAEQSRGEKPMLPVASTNAPPSRAHSTAHILQRHLTANALPTPDPRLVNHTTQPSPSQVLPHFQTQPPRPQALGPSQGPPLNHKKPVSITDSKTKQWLASLSQSRSTTSQEPLVRPTVLPNSSIQRQPSSQTSRPPQALQRIQAASDSLSQRASMGPRPLLPPGATSQPSQSSQPRPPPARAPMTARLTPGEYRAPSQGTPNVASKRADQMKPPTISAAAYRHAVANHKSQLVATRAKETDQVLASGAILLPSAAAPSRQAKAASPSLGSPSSNASYRTAAGNADLSKASSSPLHANGKFMSLKGKRKLEIIELEDDEPPKRMRTTRASALGGYSMNSKTPLELDMSDDDDDSSRPQFNFPDDLSQIAPIPNRYGQPFTAEEDALIIYLKEVKGVPWREFEQFFPPRKWPSMQTRYSKVLSRRPAQDGPLRRPALQKEPQHSTRELRRTTTHIPEDSVESSMADQEEVLKAADDEHRCRQVAPPLTYLVRHREVGATSGREWPRKFQAGIRDVANSTMGAQAYMDNASGDVSTISWSPNGKFFAAGAVAVTDAQSIEYNKPRNLVIGSSTKIRELPDHRIEHVLPNGRRKDLFATVQNVAFSPDSNYMYSAGIDHQMHRFEINGSLRETTLIHTVEHPGSVDFLSISNEGMVATGCNYSGPGSILVLAYNDDGDSRPKSARLSGTNVTKEARKYPSALKWGVSSQHKDYLLAGFSKEAEVLYAEDDHRDKEGEVALWDINSQQQIQTDAPNRNVFDLAWNPNPGRDSSIFAVASRVLGHVGHGIHSAIRLYSPGENRARHTMELDCPAWDINDVVYSPHDSNLIAVGSTQGLVHIWDVRMTKHGQSPLSTLTHGTSLAILPHEKKRWEADTGIRFLSWGSERDRLYSGSSDGVVACWNPYRSDSDKHVRDVVQLDSAIMSGAFSPDYCSLLVGEDIGRLNLLTIGNRGEKFNRQTAKFDVQEAPLVEEAAPILWDCQKMFMDNALEVKPLGLMPVHQVVQGPNYQGPYLSDEYEDKSREAAQKFQDKVLRQLNRRNKQRRKSGYKEAEACRLDCKFNPLDDDQKGENKRSQDRIPDQLWTWTEPGGARRNTCLECGGGARIVEGESTLCEKCRFSCFRCEGTVTISPRARAVECTCCGASWNLGALGYELIDSGMARMKERKHEDGKEQRSESEGLTDLCDSEDERAYFHRAPSTDSDGSELL